MEFPHSFILEYPAWWDGISRCHITIYHPDNDKYVVIATELTDNPGIHIHQVSANLATTIYYRLETSPQNIIWIEHDPAESLESARLQKVILRWDTNRYYEYDRSAIAEDEVQLLTHGHWRALI